MCFLFRWLMRSRLYKSSCSSHRMKSFAHKHCTQRTSCHLPTKKKPTISFPLLRIPPSYCIIHYANAAMCNPVYWHKTRREFTDTDTTRETLISANPIIGATLLYIARKCSQIRWVEQQTASRGTGCTGLCSERSFEHILFDPYIWQHLDVLHKLHG